VRQPRGYVRLIGLIASFAGAAIVLAGAGGLLTEIGPWYRGLRKSRVQPPDWAFGPAWTIILTLWAAAGVLAWSGADAAGAEGAGAHVRIAAVFAVNFILHLVWSPLFFKFKRPDWAMIEMPLLWLSILALTIVVAPYSTWAPWMLVPYLVWVSFAMWINLAIIRLNGPFGAR
jgi:tryptophan-rich sensory protein